MLISRVLHVIIFVHTMTILPTPKALPLPFIASSMSKLVSASSQGYSSSNTRQTLSPVLPSAKGEVYIQHQHQTRPENLVREDDYGYWNPVPYSKGDAGPIPHDEVAN
ncbi:unnamed protein product [Amaranthus hypochondriacus]